MAVFLLIRHGQTDMIGRRLAGRHADIHLDKKGREQADTLAARLGHLPVRRIFSSPLERCRETAAPLAERLGLDVDLLEDIQEIDFGDWAGRSFRELDKDPLWRQYNRFRSGTRIPGGELITEVQSRMVTAVERLRRQFPEGMIALYSHGDPIKTALCHYTGIPLDFIRRLEVALASVNALAIDDDGPRLLCINNTNDLPPFT